MIDNRGNKKENIQEKSFPKVHVNCDKTIYRKFHETIENTYFFTSRFFRIYSNNV